MNPQTCPVCGIGKLVEHRHERQSEIDEHKFVIRDLLHSLCADCGERVTTPDQSRHNKRIISETRAQAVAERDRLERLTPADILRIRKKMGITQAQAARVFGGGANAFSKYENDAHAPSDGMERLLRLSDSIPAAAKWLLRRAGLPPELAVDPDREVSLAVTIAFRRRKGDFPSASQHVAQVLAAASSLATNVPAPRSLSFTYESKDAANDPEASELVAVG